MSLITVRPATPADAEFLVRGNAAMALETESLTLDMDRLRRGIHGLFEDPNRGFYLVAETDGRRVGQLMITYEWSDWRNGVFWWVQSVYVVPECRGQGVYRRLYQEVHELAKRARNVCGIRLYVEAENQRAQATYERCGMSRTAYVLYEDDFIIMRTGAH
jgi:ribosomal protein S18 acetylase RimI-like enzyme